MGAHLDACLTLLYPRGSCRQYSLERGLGGPQSRSGHRKEENLLPMPGIETRFSGSSDRSPAITLRSRLIILQTPVHYISFAYK
jgi:hypothetical protein